MPKNSSDIEKENYSHNPNILITQRWVISIKGKNLELHTHNIIYIYIYIYIRTPSTITDQNDYWCKEIIPLLKRLHINGFEIASF